MRSIGKSSATIVVSALVLLIGGLITATMMTAVVYRVWAVANEVRRSSLESQQELPQTVGVAVYNMSLCSLLNNTIEPKPWNLVVYNAGNKRMLVDHIAIELDGRKVREWEQEYMLLPGQYRHYELSGVCEGGECARVKVHVHTADGVYRTGGYSIPDPYLLTERKDGRCHEPGG